MCCVAKEIKDHYDENVLLFCAITLKHVITVNAITSVKSHMHLGVVLQDRKQHEKSCILRTRNI